MSPATLFKRKSWVSGVVILLYMYAMAVLWSTVSTYFHPVAQMAEDDASFTPQSTGTVSDVMISSRAATEVDPGKGATWENDFDVVHVLQTRFMQQQPNLMRLGRGRLRLFKSFCFPSVRAQSTQQFLWVLRCDPHLHPELLQGLLQLVQGVPNIVVMASNEFPDGFRKGWNLTQESEKSILSGSWELLQSYHLAAQNRTVLESRLDADDGLEKTFLQDIQIQASKALVSVPNAWNVWCAESIIEWQFYSPVNNNSSGWLAPLPSSSFCITSGLTWAYAPSVEPSHRTVSAHHRIHEMIPLCKDGRRNHCVTHLSAAIRARTPTSAAMVNVVDANKITNVKRLATLDESEKSRFRTLQNQLWRDVFFRFGVRAEEVIETRSWMEKHMEGILADALEGQCTIPGSCQKSAEKQLRGLQKILSQK